MIQQREAKRSSSSSLSLSQRSPGTTATSVFFFSQTNTLPVRGRSCARGNCGSASEFCTALKLDRSSASPAAGEPTLSSQPQIWNAAAAAAGPYAHGHGSVGLSTHISAGPGSRKPTSITTWRRSLLRPVTVLPNCYSTQLSRTYIHTDRQTELTSQFLAHDDHSLRYRLVQNVGVNRLGRSDRQPICPVPGSLHSSAEHKTLYVSTLIPVAQFFLSCPGQVDRNLRHLCSCCSSRQSSLLRFLPIHPREETLNAMYCSRLHPNMRIEMSSKRQRGS